MMCDLEFRRLGAAKSVEILALVSPASKVGKLELVNRAAGALTPRTVAHSPDIDSEVSRSSYTSASQATRAGTEATTATAGIAAQLIAVGALYAESVSETMR